MKSPKAVEQKDILKYGKKYNIPEEHSYALDTAYFSYLFSFDSSEYKTQIKNHYQPLQALYYSADGQLRSFHPNCYAGGFPNLDWEQDGKFDAFLPAQQAPLDNLVPLSKHLEFLIPTVQAGKPSIKGYDYIVLVHWSRFMGRQSERLIELVQNNAKLAGQRKALILYVNNDNLFSMGD